MCMLVPIIYVVYTASHHTMSETVVQQKLNIYYLSVVKNFFLHSVLVFFNFFCFHYRYR